MVYICIYIYTNIDLVVDFYYTKNIILSLLGKIPFQTCMQMRDNLSYFTHIYVKCILYSTNTKYQSYNNNNNYGFINSIVI